MAAPDLIRHPGAFAGRTFDYSPGTQSPVPESIGGGGFALVPDG
jgi:hypothetical protein